MIRKRGNILKLEEWINTKLGQDIWHRKYQHNSETFDEWLDRVSGGNETIRRLIVEKKFLFGGRILANRGIKDKKVVLNNCFTVDQPEDNIESIYSIASDIAKTFSVGGGCGVNISKLSPKGAKVNNAAETTTGAVSFIDLYDMTSGLISQHGRRGALMVTINSDHPDLVDFINLKSNPEKATKCNMSVMVSDEFMHKAIDNENVVLKFTRPETGEKITKTVNASDVLDLIAKRNWEMAEPGMLFYDTINNNHLLSEYDDIDIKTTNPCFDGNMKLLIEDNGKFVYKTFNELENKEPNIVSIDGRYSRGKVFCSGNKETIQLNISNNEKIICTPDHRLMDVDGNEVLAKDSEGKKLMPFDHCSFDKAIIVDSIEKAGTRKVFDFQENINHWGCVNNVIVHNCGK